MVQLHHGHGAVAPDFKSPAILPLLVSPDRIRDGETGQFDEKFSSNQYLEAVRRLEPTTTGEVADELDCHRNTARRNLEKLADSGRVQKTERSGAFLWTTN